MNGSLPFKKKIGLFKLNTAFSIQTRDLFLSCYMIVHYWSQSFSQLYLIIYMRLVSQCW